MTLARSALLWGALLAVGCRSTPDAELILVVETDLEVPAELDRIEVSIDRAAPHALDLGGADQLPATLTILPGPSGPEATIEVEVTGLAAGERIVSERASAPFVRGEARTLVVWLLDACRDPDRPCDPDETCTPTGCRHSAYGAEELLAWDDRYSTDRLDGGVAGDGSVFADGGGCVAEGRETCSPEGRDEDCDGLVDEAADNPDVEGMPAGDTAHCGRCRNACREADCDRGFCGGFWGLEAAPGTSCVLPQTGVVACRGTFGPSSPAGTDGLPWVARSARLMAVGPQATGTEGDPAACAILDGPAACAGGPWGDYPASPSAPPTIAVGTDTDALVVGTAHACIAQRGEVFCWGAYEEGQLARGTLDMPDGWSATTVYRVPSLADVSSLAAGGYFTCAATLGGQVLCWGRNECGQLGRGPAGSHGLPAPVLRADGGGNLEGVRRVSCAGGAPSGVTCGGDEPGGAPPAHCCAVDADGQVWCWGANGEGQVTGAASTVQNVARRLELPAEMGPVRSVEVAAGVSCAVAEAPEGDDVWCWGDDGDLLGGLPSGVSRWSPPDPARPVSIRALSLSSARWTTDPNDGDWGVHALVMTWDGRVLCWGDRRGGPCDDTSPTDETVVELDWGAW